MNLKIRNINLLFLLFFTFVSVFPFTVSAQEISNSPRNENEETTKSVNREVSSGVIPPSIQKNTDDINDIPDNVTNQNPENTPSKKNDSSSDAFLSKEYLNFSLNSNFAIDNHGVYLGASGHFGLFFPKTIGLRLTMGILVNTLETGDTGAILYPELSTLVFYKHDAQKTKGFKRYLKFSIELLAFLGRSGGDAPSLEVAPAGVFGIGIIWKPYRFLGFNFEISGHAYSPQNYNDSGFLINALAGISLHF